MISVRTTRVLFGRIQINSFYKYCVVFNSSDFQIKNKYLPSMFKASFPIFKHIDEGSDISQVR